MTRSTRYPLEIRERAVRMVFEHEPEHPSQWATIRSVSSKFGMSAETLRSWVRQTERDEGRRPGLTTTEREQLKALERENRELRRANEILKSASAFFAAELDRRQSRRSATSTETRPGSGSSRSAGTCRSPRRPTTTPRPGRPRPEHCETRS